jgi:FtsZ-interacting cell division protein YlmF
MKLFGLGPKDERNGENAPEACGDGGAFLRQPVAFTQTPEIASLIVNRATVILNVESLDCESARRVLDFVGGTAYACGYGINRISSGAFIFTPPGVGVGGETEYSDSGEATIEEKLG